MTGVLIRRGKAVFGTDIAGSSHLNKQTHSQKKGRICVCQRWGVVVVGVGKWNRMKAVRKYELPDRR